MMKIVATNIPVDRLNGSTPPSDCIVSNVKKASLRKPSETDAAVGETNTCVEDGGNTIVANTDDTRFVIVISRAGVCTWNTGVLARSML